MSADHCNALVLSGGGANGAWEAGVIWGLLHYGNPDDFKWDVVSGVSAGSINSAGLIGFEVGDEVRASEFLSYIWSNISNDQVYQKWSSGGPLRWITSYPGLVDNSPAMQMARDILSYYKNGVQRSFNMSAVNVGTGEYHNFTELNTPFENIPDAIISSASIPFMFPPHLYEGEYYMDGMTAWNVNLSSAISRCLEKVDDDTKITVDIAICGESSIEEAEETKDAIDNFFRAREVQSYYVNDNSLQGQMAAHPNVNYRYLFQQKEKLSGLKEMDFTNSTTWDYQEYGRRDAMEMLNQGEGVSFMNFISSKFNPVQ